VRAREKESERARERERERERKGERARESKRERERERERKEPRWAEYNFFFEGLPPERTRSLPKKEKMVATHMASASWCCATHLIEREREREQERERGGERERSFSKLVLRNSFIFFSQDTT